MCTVCSLGLNHRESDAQVLKHLQLFSEYFTHREVESDRFVIVCGVFDVSDCVKISQKNAPRETGHSAEHDTNVAWTSEWEVYATSVV